MMMPTRPLAALLLASIPLIAAPLAASAQPASALSLRVAGDGVDAHDLAGRLGVELGVAIDIDDACPSPCLAVVIEDAHAIVAFTPGGDGARARARMIDLGGDRDMWPVLITLLAGNLARDEAADVLASLPEPAPPRVIDSAGPAASAG